MPFALSTIGLLLVITGFQNTYKQLGSQIAKDFTGSGNFTYWVIAIFAVGALGYNDTLKPFSRAFLALIIVGIFLANKGFFNQINSEVSSGTSTTPLPAGGLDATLATASAGAAAAEGGGSGLFGDLGSLTSIVDIGASLF